MPEFRQNGETLDIQKRSVIFAIAMPRVKDTTFVGIDIPDKLLAAVDQLVELMKAVDRQPWSRSAVVRAALAEWVEQKTPSLVARYDEMVKDHEEGRSVLAPAAVRGVKS